MMRRAITLLAVACALSLGAPMVAGAASSGTPSQAISDCNANGRLTSYYSPDVLKSALAQMPSDVKEYTDCYDVIERQLFKELGSSGTVTAPKSSSSSSFLPTWLIIVIVVLALAAIAFGAMAIRRRSGGPGGPGGPGAGGPPDGPGAGGPPDGPGAGGPPPAPAT
jgi:hypothetical protein